MHARSLLAFFLVLLLTGIPCLKAQDPEGADPEINATINLLVSPLAQEQVAGQAELAEKRAEYLRRLEGKIRDSSQPPLYAAAQLGLLISPWLQGKEGSARSLGSISFDSIRRPVGKMTESQEKKRLRRLLQEAVEGVAARMPPDPRVHYFSHRTTAICLETLTEVANDETMDWALARLQTEKEPEVAEAYFKLAESYLGIGPLFRTNGLCGLSTEEEQKRFHERQGADIAEGRAKLIQTWSTTRPLDSPGRIRAAIAHWRADVLSKQRTSSGILDHDNWSYTVLEPLVRLGDPAVPILRAQLADEETIEAKAVWQILISTITGEEATDLVRQLADPQASDACHRYACEIILVSGSKAWLPELEALQTTPGFDTRLPSRVIATCHGPEGMPALERGLAWNPHNSSAKYAIEEFRERAAQGQPKGLSFRRLGL
jgi:hypothetical protein